MTESPAQSAEEVFLFPATASQMQIWYLHAMEPEASAYNIPFVFRYRGTLDIEALRKSLQSIVDRFESLRTTFDAVDGELRQVVHAARRIEVSIDDVSHESPEAIARLVDEVSKEEAARPYDLRQDLMVRARVIRAQADDHYLLLGFHHIAVDHIAVLRLKRELETTYASVAGGKGMPSFPEELQFGDFAVWQAEKLADDSFRDSLQYWKGELEGRPSVLPLPTDRPRPKMQTFKGSEFGFTIAADVAGRFQETCRKLGVTPFVTMLSALHLLLYRYTGQRDITIGCPFANRGHEELQDVVGMFVNMLPIAVAIDPQAGFSTLVREVRARINKAQGNQEIPFDNIMREIDGERDPAYSPVFQVLFTFQEPPMSLALAGAGVESIPQHNQGAKLDLSFWFWAEGNELKGLIEFNTDLFDRATIERMSQHYVHVLAAISADTEAPLERIPVLGAGEYALVTSDWNQANEDLGADGCLHEYFEAQVRKSADRTALRSGEEAVSYGELNERINRMAHWLIEEKGVGPEDIVALMMDRSVDMIVAVYAILKAGGAYLPIDTEILPARLEHILGEAGPRVILADGKFAGSFANADPRLVVVDGLQAKLGGYAADNPEPRARPDNAAYVLYTSGTTGVPKGVVNEHRGVANRLCWYRKNFPLQAADRLLQKTPYTFDVSVWEIFQTLIEGATLVIPAPDEHKDPKRLISLVVEHGITVIHFVPSMLHALLAEKTVSDITSLRTVYSGGEALSKDLSERFFAVFDEVELVNQYGPTEAAIDVTYWRCRRGDGVAVIPIGRPYSNVKTLILDASQRPVPVGVVGELYIGGVQAARGYLRRDDLTAAAFVPDPLKTGDGTRFYKTGDLCKYLPDGNIVYVGRSDSQVKLRGLRVELGEIEAALASFDGIEAAVASTWKVSDADLRVIGYYVPAAGRKVAVIELRKFLRQRLPGHMIPQHFVALDAMPRTTSGKLDRKRLPAPNVSSRTGAVRKPTTEAETLLVNLWNGLLDRDSVSVDDYFFEIGGHSLLALRVLNSIEAETGVRLTPRMIIMQSLSELAANLDRQRGEVGSAGAGAT